MKTIIIEPLKEWYKTIDVRTTSLEEFATCAYKYRFNKPMYDKDVLKFGKQIHEIVQADLIDRTWKFWDRIINEYTKTNETDSINRLSQYRSLFRDRDLFKEFEVVHVEKSMYLWIELWDYLVVISGTADLVWYYQINWVKEKLLMDIKTSQAEWNEETIKWKFQNKIYPFIDELTTWVTAHSFVYTVATKHVNPRSQEVWMEYETAVAEDLIKWLAQMIVEATMSWVRKPQKGYRCNRCPLKKDGCPARNTESFTL